MFGEAGRLIMSSDLFLLPVETPLSTLTPPRDLSHSTAPENSTSSSSSNLIPSLTSSNLSTTSLVIRSRVIALDAEKIWRLGSSSGIALCQQSPRIRARVRGRQKGRKERRWLLVDEERPRCRLLLGVQLRSLPSSPISRASSQLFPVRPHPRAPLPSYLPTRHH
jgi:hypothetical protein